MGKGEAPAGKWMWVTQVLIQNSHFVLEEVIVLRWFFYTMQTWGIQNTVNHEKI